ncbi:hypothetical protein GQX74_000992 [Glossina fuscipes]|uniref:Uncharacterized protein n=1 Tax=Glossina palpalis gambiensis TaxID=67801 RepID=A0A1B0BFI8_9MUSC|nr:hypothetical protein GQX74_000992 [Glossina fuscipes]
MNKSIENLLQQNSGEMSSERQSSEDVQESTTTADDAAIEGDGDFTDDNNFESNLRRRKGKIISCAKETIENVPVLFEMLYKKTQKIIREMGTFIKWRNPAPN